MNLLDLLETTHTKNGNQLIVKSLSNLKIIIANDDELAGRIKLNVLTGFIEKNDLPFGGRSKGIWSDVDDSRLVIFIKEKFGVEFVTTKVNEALKIVAEDNSYHPVKDYLNSLVWDGQSRVENFFSNYFGASNNIYSQTVSRITLLSAVARILSPGCKVDTITILEGEQGIGKSTGLRALAGGVWFKDDKLDIENMGKDTLIQLSGAWLYELGELATLRKAEADSLKSFISKQVDTYRPPYGRNLVQMPRQLIFVGTINPRDGYLKDTTGNRRYLPIKCGDNVSISAITRDRDQIWAEAVQIYLRGDGWHWERGSDIDKIIRSEVELREDSDSWEESIANWLNDKQTCTINGIWEGVFDKAVVDLRKIEQIRIGTVLKSLGWLSRHVRRDGKKIREYYKPQSEPVSEVPETVLKSAMAVIYEMCKYDLNSNEKLDVESKLGRAFVANKEVFDVAEEFGKNFQVALNNGKYPAEALASALTWFESLLNV